MALLTRVRTRAELVAHRRVRALLEGRHVSALHGRSLDFADLRAYVPGDDVADVDWKATARHGDLLVKRHVAERRATVVLVVDTGRELAAASHWDPDGPGQADLKRDVAVTAAGLLGWMALRAGDRVGLVHSGPHGPVATRPTTREVDLERMLVSVQEACQPDSPAQRTLDLLDHATGALRRRTLMVLVLGDVEVDSLLERRLARLAAQHELVVVTVADLDPLPPLRRGRRVTDVRGRRRLPGFVAEDPELAAELRGLDVARAAHREEVLRRLGAAHVHLAEHDAAITDLLDLLERRRRRAR